MENNNINLNSNFKKFIRQKRLREYENKIYNKKIIDDKKYNDLLKEGDTKDKKFKRFEDGIEFTPFDLKEENEEGFFDENDFYIKNKEKYDPWYDQIKDEIEEKEKNLSKKNKNNNLLKINDDKNLDKNIENDEESIENESKNENNNNDKSEEISKYSEEDLYYKEEPITKQEKIIVKNEIYKYRIQLLKYFINEKEILTNALRRLNPNKNIHINNKNKNNKNSINNNIENKNENKKNYENLLEIVTKLTELNFFDLYQDNIQKIIKDYGYENTFLWKYKTINIKDGKEIEYGPFTTIEIKNWIKNNFFEENDQIKFLFCFIDYVKKEKNPNSNKWFNLKDEAIKKYLF